MRILHTADLHIGQIIYQYYERTDEHIHFFSQLRKWIEEYTPDLLIVSGDVFDIPQPSASNWRLFTDTFVSIRKCRPEMAIVIIAGNHDSPSRLQSNSSVWQLANTKIAGTPPPLNFQECSGWEEDYIVRLPSGYVITLPFMNSDRSDTAIAIQEYIAMENTDQLPVVMTGHTAVSGSDFAGHDIEIGKLRTTDIEKFGHDYDYLALGHIHRPQTIGHPEDMMKEVTAYPAPVARYSGSAVHVSCDESYPHSVSLIDIDSHGGEVRIRQLKIDQLRHFITLPLKDDPFDNQKKIIKYLKKFIESENGCYIRFRVKNGTDLSSDFNNLVYEIIEKENIDIRYNPKIIWTGETAATTTEDEGSAEIAVEEIQQIRDPLDFIRMTANKYPTLDLDSLADAFAEIEEELIRMQEEEDVKMQKSVRKA